MTSTDNKTTRAEANAVKLLLAKGYSVIEPSRVPPQRRPLDQCEYPDREGSPGDTCMHEARRNRTTSQGTMWLCSDHFHAHESQLFDERVAP